LTCIYFCIYAGPLSYLQFDKPFYALCAQL
jgi:hypothetical protein